MEREAFSKTMCVDLRIEIFMNAVMRVWTVEITYTINMINIKADFKNCKGFVKYSVQLLASKFFSIIAVCVSFMYRIERTLA